MTAILTRDERRFETRGVATSVAVAAAVGPTIRRFDRQVGRAAVEVTDHTTDADVSSGRLAVSAVGTFFTVIVWSLVFLSLVPVAFGFRPVVVASGSMSPALRTSDVVVTDTSRDVLGVGSVIDYETADGSRIHRIVQVTEDGYRTKGDANPTPDPDPVAFVDVNGVGVMVVPFIGLANLWFEQQRWRHLSVLVYALVMASMVTSRGWVERSDHANRHGGSS